MALTRPGMPMRQALRRGCLLAAVWLAGAGGLSVAVAVAVADTGNAGRRGPDRHAGPVRVGVIEIPPLVMGVGAAGASPAAYEGLAIDYLRLYEKRLDFRADIVAYPDWKTLLEAARSREVDAVLTTVDTPDRRSFLAFPAPYVTLRNVIIGRQGELRGDIGLEHLAGRRVAVLEASAVQERIAREFPQIRVQPQRDERAVLSSVGLHESDFGITELSRAAWWIEHDRFATLQVVGRTPFDYALALAVRSDWPELAAQIDQVGRSIAAAEREAIEGRWVRLDADGALARLSRGPAPWAVLAALLAAGATAAIAWTLRRRHLRRSPDLALQLRQAEAAKAAAEASATQFEQLLRLSADFTWETNDKLVLVGLRIYGDASLPFTEAALLGKAWWDIPWSAIAASELDLLGERMAAHEPIRLWIARWVDDSGGPRWLSISGEPIYDERSAFTGYRGTGRDVTDRFRQKGKLTEALQRMAALQEGTVSFLGLLTPDGDIIDCNRALSEFAGVAKEALVGRPFGEVPLWRIEEEAERLRAAVVRARSGEVVRYEARVVDAAGSVHWIDFSLNPFFDPLGKLLFLVPEGRDITDAKRAATALDNLLSATGGVYGETFFRKLVESMGRLLAVRWVLVGQLGAEGDRVKTLAVWADGAFAGNFDFTLEHTPTQKLMEVSCCVYPRNVRAIFPGDPLLQRFGADSYMGVPVQGAAGRVVGVLLVLHDRPLLETASARRLMELLSIRAGTEMDRTAHEVEVRMLNAGLEARVAGRTAELQQANRELEAFSFSVSHDLRAPLRHIGGFVGMLAEDRSSALSAEGRGYLEVIADAARRMGGMIDDLLALSRSGRAELRRSPVAMNELVASLVDRHRHGLSEQHIEFSIGTLPVVDADRGLLTLALDNLLDNAAKYSRSRNPAMVCIELDPSSNEREWVFVVRDNGIGFDMRYAERLFGVFQRLHADSEYEGTGVGLANVRRIIERHGGRVRAESVPGHGAAFYFTLPRGTGANPSA